MSEAQKQSVASKIDLSHLDWTLRRVLAPKIGSNSKFEAVKLDKPEEAFAIRPFPNVLGPYQTYRLCLNFRDKNDKSHQLKCKFAHNETEMTVWNFMKKYSIEDLDDLSEILALKQSSIANTEQLKAQITPQTNRVPPKLMDLKTTSPSELSSNSTDSKFFNF